MMEINGLLVLVLVMIATACATYLVSRLLVDRSASKRFGPLRATIEKSHAVDVRYCIDITNSLVHRIFAGQIKLHVHEGGVLWEQERTAHQKHVISVLDRVSGSAWLLEPEATLSFSEALGDVLDFLTDFEVAHSPNDARTRDLCDAILQKYKGRFYTEQTGRRSPPD